MTFETPLLYKNQLSGKQPLFSAARWAGGGAASLSFSRKVVLPSLLVVFTIVAWQLIVDWAQIPTVILASPIEVFSKIVKFYPLLLENAGTDYSRISWRVRYYCRPWDFPCSRDHLFAVALRRVLPQPRHLPVHSKNSAGTTVRSLVRNPLRVAFGVFGFYQFFPYADRRRGGLQQRRCQYDPSL